MHAQNEILVHVVKTIQYRFMKVLAGSKEDFGSFKISEHTRCPAEIIHHMFDLTVKTRMMIIEGHFNVPPVTLLIFSDEKERFIDELNELELVIGSNKIDIVLGLKLLQGPLSDILTHIGQVAMLNGLHGNKIPKENYYAAQIN